MPRGPGRTSDPQRARHVRVVEYEVPDREGDGKDELIALVTTITGLRRPRRRTRLGLPSEMGA